MVTLANNQVLILIDFVNQSQPLEMSGHSHPNPLRTNVEGLASELPRRCISFERWTSSDSIDPKRLIVAFGENEQTIL